MGGDKGVLLAAIGRVVLSRFSGLCHLAEDPYQTGVAKEFDRFKLWAFNLGLYHSGHSSLDYRFRDSPVLFEYAGDLLNDLDNTLSKLEQIIGDSSTTHNSDSHPQEYESGYATYGSEEEDEEEEDLSSYLNDAPEKAYVENISMLIGRLYDLAFKIRNPKTRTGLSKARGYRDVDPDTGVELITQYADNDISHLVEVFRLCYWPGSDKTTEDVKSHFLVQRLARANTQRRQQFKYWKKRRSQYETYSELDAPDEPVEADIAGLKSIERDNPTAGVPRSVTSRPSTATFLDSKKVSLDDDVSMASTSSFLDISPGEEHTEGLNFLEPPKVPPGTTEFECPYCLTMCSVKMLDERAWRKHIIRDMRPYVCTYEDCREPDQQYDTLTSWVSHEVLIHGSPSGGEKTCPFCGKQCHNRHIAGHFHRIACFSLPQSAQLDDGQARSISSKAPDITSRSSATSSESFSWQEWIASIKDITVKIPGYEDAHIEVHYGEDLEMVIARLKSLHGMDERDPLGLTNGRDKVPSSYKDFNDGMVLNGSLWIMPEPPPTLVEASRKIADLASRHQPSVRSPDYERSQTISQTSSGIIKTSHQRADPPSRSQPSTKDHYDSPQRTPHRSSRLRPEVAPPSILPSIWQPLLATSRQGPGPSLGYTFTNPVEASYQRPNSLGYPNATGDGYYRDASITSQPFPISVQVPPRYHPMGYPTASIRHPTSPSTMHQTPLISDQASPRVRDPLLGYPHSSIMPQSASSQKPDPPLGYPPSARDPYTLDPRYSVQPRSYFRPGKVFSILWHENLESESSSGTHKSAGPQCEGRFGESIYTTIRRMVIIREKGNCCWCFAINTYGGRGVGKLGVDRTKHTIVYMQNGYPMHGSDEPFMTKEPLEVAPERPDETLDGMSRLNFGKIYTVEHNIKILPIGAITATSLPKFLNYARAELN